MSGRGLKADGPEYLNGLVKLEFTGMLADV